MKQSPLACASTSATKRETVQPYDKHLLASTDMVGSVSCRSIRDSVEAVSLGDVVAVTDAAGSLHGFGALLDVPVDGADGGNTEPCQAATDVGGGDGGDRCVRCGGVVISLAGAASGWRRRSRCRGCGACSGAGGREPECTSWSGRWGGWGSGRVRMPADPRPGAAIRRRRTRQAASRRVTPATARSSGAVRRF